MEVSRRSAVKASGFQANSTLLDGTGWVPEKNLHGQNKFTEYRNRFNHAKPFHRTNLRMSTGHLKRHSVDFNFAALGSYV